LVLRGKHMKKITNRKALLVFWIGTVVREEYANKD